MRMKWCRFFWTRWPSRRCFLSVAGAACLTAGLSVAMADQAFAAGENQAANQAKLEGAFDYIVVDAGASGAIIAGELSKTGAKVLVVGSGGADTSPSRTYCRRSGRRRIGKVARTNGAVPAGPSTFASRAIGGRAAELIEAAK
jgi:hypothetical protein